MKPTHLQILGGLNQCVKSSAFVSYSHYRHTIGSISVLPRVLGASPYFMPQKEANPLIQKTKTTVFEIDRAKKTLILNYLPNKTNQSAVEIPGHLRGPSIQKRRRDRAETRSTPEPEGCKGSWELAAEAVLRPRSLSTESMGGKKRW